MTTKLEVSWIQSISKDGEDIHPFFLEYICPAIMPVISRNGLYLNSWKSYSKENISSNEILHEAHSLLLPNSKNETTFFRLKNKENSIKKEKTLIVFLLDPWIIPKYALADALECLKKKVDLSSMELYSFVGTFSLFSPAKHLDYLNSYYETIYQSLGIIPKMLDLLEIQKMSSMKEWHIYEGGTSWFCSDNFIVHLALSKGANYIPYYQEINFKKLSEFMLSRHHSMEIGRGAKRKDTDPFELFESFSNDEFKNVSFSELGVPDVFMATIYKALLGA